MKETQNVLTIEKSRWKTHGEFEKYNLYEKRLDRVHQRTLVN